jgi:hypothetical protein
MERLANGVAQGEELRVSRWVRITGALGQTVGDRGKPRTQAFRVLDPVDELTAGRVERVVQLHREGLVAKRP